MVCQTTAFANIAHPFIVPTTPTTPSVQPNRIFGHIEIWDHKAISSFSPFSPGQVFGQYFASNLLRGKDNGMWWTNSYGPKVWDLAIVSMECVY